ncbi:amidohydrolase family protein [Paraburkholderia caballeronis]|uniref:amidohydrolase family protein n=1 Tax=Paraburkholderia caballeronis TaxID=416943 RepID=UPI001064ED0D|nr:amidohydrolase family protein [Paraburkholderia caballeronis]TDV02355.1 putative TIM-barrel fold metal-dependent hydrolase [Paraburkholderia caballeronis]TDV16732.1 putative TIM-barrel fold metal-dependent hydrolase [Paraburkholderia caballeronis]TDV18771.1 putative TIM-barrel fold metal-dependent hydrolase [Paraburkholderia caballeronis]TDV35549.1 putative TIM-barrel fold metal-dependent hydrolase [Paraburkholderia caballeronis]
MSTTATEQKHAVPHIPVRPEWLAQRAEAALEPGLPIIDAHHHLWEFPDKRYRTRDLLDDLASGHNIRATVFVECKTHYDTDAPVELASAGEMRFALAEAREAKALGAAADVGAAFVGNADLLRGDAVGPVLDHLIEASEGRLRSIRNIAVWHADPDVRPSAATPPARLLLDPAFRAGVAQLAPRKLAFDAWLIHTQLPELCGLAEAASDTPIVLNHIGGPLALGRYRGQRDAVFAAWRDDIRRVAQYPNVHVKLGGFGMPLFGFGFEKTALPPDSASVADAIRPYVETCIDAFGAARCMFESNFPVDKGSFGYGIAWNAFKRVSAGLPDADRAALFHDTAARFYRITG